MTASTGSKLAQRFPFISGAVAEGNRAVVGISLVAAIGGFLFIKKDFGLTSGQVETVVASILVGAALGAIISGYLADAIGRRKTKIISGSVYFVAALGAAFSGTYWELVASRFGLGLGTASFLTSSPA